MNLDVQRALFIARQPTAKKAEGGDVAPTPAPMPDYSKPDPLGLYSHAATVAAKMPMQKGTPEQIKGYLLKQGVKPDEVKHSGFDERLGGKPMVTREQVAQHFHGNRPKLEEKILADKRTSETGKTVFDDQEELAQRHYQTPYAGLASEQRRRVLDEIHSKQPTKFGTYVLPGGSNYREALTKLPSMKEKKPDWKVVPHPNGEGFALQNHTGYKLAPEGYVQAGAPLRWETRDLAENAGMPVYNRDTANFTSSHWDDPNVVLHRRMSDRVDPATKQKILHLEELQSDWGQKGRSEGFQPPDLHKMEARRREIEGLGHSATSEQKQEWADIMNRLKPDDRDIEGIPRYKGVGNIPNGPYVDSTSKWLDLGLKRTLHDAAKGGYHKVVWTPGEEQAKRYDLSKQVSRVLYRPESKELMAWPHSGDADVEPSIHRRNVEPAHLPDIIGKEAAEKLINRPKDTSGAHILSGEQLKVGGEGMKAFYDKMLPQALLKLAKRHDPEAKLDTHMLKADNAPEDVVDKWAAKDPEHPFVKKNRMPVPSLEITPKMRASILKGQSAFAEGGAVEPAEHEQIERIPPNRRTKEQVHKLEAHKAGRSLEPAPDPVPSIIHHLPRLEPQPTVRLASGGKAERQIGDYTPKQAAAAPHIEGGDIVDRAFNLINDRTAKAEGGAVEGPDKLDKLCEAIEAQGKRLDALTQLLAAPQIVERDENKLVTQIRRDVKG